MADSRIFGHSAEMFGKAVDISATRHNHLLDNVENSSAMKGENSEEVDIYHLDSVNIDTQMMNLMENNIKYSATTEMLLRKITILNYSIGEGGR